MLLADTSNDNAGLVASLLAHNHHGEVGGLQYALQCIHNQLQLTHSSGSYRFADIVRCTLVRNVGFDLFDRNTHVLAIELSTPSADFHKLLQIFWDGFVRQIDDKLQVKTIEKWEVQIGRNNTTVYSVENHVEISRRNVFCHCPQPKCEVLSTFSHLHVRNAREWIEMKL